MRRCMLIEIRITLEKETNVPQLWLTLVKLPKTTSKGALFYPPKAEMFSYVCVNQSKTPKDFDDLKSLNPGTLFDVTYVINDFTGKPVVGKVEVVPGSNKHSSLDLYL